MRPGKALRNLRTPFKPLAHDKIRRAGRVTVVFMRQNFSVFEGKRRIDDIVHRSAGLGKRIIGRPGAGAGVVVCTDIGIADL